MKLISSNLDKQDTYRTKSLEKEIKKVEPVTYDKKYCISECKS